MAVHDIDQKGPATYLTYLSIAKNITIPNKSWGFLLGAEGDMELT